MLENYIAIGIIAILAMALLVYLIYQNELIDISKKRNLFLAVSLVIIVIIAELCTTAAEGRTDGLRILNIVSNIIGFCASPFIPIIIGFVMSTNIKNKKYVFIPAVINAIVTFLSPIGGYIFSISDDNIYSRGSFFFIYLIAIGWSLLILIKTSFNTTHHYYDKNRYVIILMTLVLLLGVSVQVFSSHIHTAWLCAALVLILYYAFICEYNDKYDVLSSLFNRREFEKIKKRLGDREQVYIILFDIDNFKHINDTEGHLCGDYCINRVGTIISEAFEEVGVGFRIGGDEFCVLSINESEKQITSALEQFVLKINKQRAKDVSFPQVSFGSALYIKNESKSITDIFNEADNALYELKEKHKKSCG